MKAIDPVCGMSVEPDGAWANLEHEGTVYSFCSSACAKAFAEHPEKYAAKTAVPSHEHGSCCGGHGQHQEKKAVHAGHGGGCCNR